MNECNGYKAFILCTGAFPEIIESPLLIEDCNGALNLPTTGCIPSLSPIVPEMRWHMTICKVSVVDRRFDASFAERTSERCAVIALVRSEPFRSVVLGTDNKRIDRRQRRIEVGHVRFRGEYGKGQTIAIYQNAPF
jgi:hypothetical protein